MQLPDCLSCSSLCFQSCGECLIDCFIHTVFLAWLCNEPSRCCLRPLRSTLRGVKRMWASMLQWRPTHTRLATLQRTRQFRLVPITGAGTTEQNSSVRLNGMMAVGRSGFHTTSNVVTWTGKTHSRHSILGVRIKWFVPNDPATSMQQMFDIAQGIHSWRIQTHDQQGRWKLRRGSLLAEAKPPGCFDRGNGHVRHAAKSTGIKYCDAGPDAVEILWHQ